MSYYDLPKGSADCELGRCIYMEALAGRRGFRYGQLGIEDPEIWREIFEAIAAAALGEMKLSVDAVENIILATEPADLSDRGDKIWTRRMAVALSAALARAIRTPDNPATQAGDTP